MRIPLITNHNLPKYTNYSKGQSFGTNENTYRFEPDSCTISTSPHQTHPTPKLVRTNTYAFREDLDWKGLARLFDRNFKNKDKVNVYSIACSDGSEPYSLIITLLEELGEQKAAKFFPIMASDKNEEVIDFNKNGIWNLKSSELKEFKERRYIADKYIQAAPKKIQLRNDAISPYTTSYRINEKVLKNVNFQRKDLIEQLKNIKDESNTVVMCRNVLPYFYDTAKVLEVAKLAGEKLKKGSLFIVGISDSQTDIRDFLLNVGFTYDDENPYVFKKIR